MLYAIMATDIASSSALRLKHRSAHIEQLNALRDEGRLILAGPHPAIDCKSPGTTSMTGSLIVGDFLSIQQAEEWIKQDSYYLAGVFSEISVKPFTQVLP